MCRNGRSSDLPPGIERLPVNLQQSLDFIITDWSYMNFQWLLFDPFIRGGSQQRDCPGFPPDSLLITREGKPLAIYFAKICLFSFLSKSMLTFIFADYVPVLLQ